MDRFRCRPGDSGHRVHPIPFGEILRLAFLQYGVGAPVGRGHRGQSGRVAVPEAVRKATENAKNKMIRVHLKDNRTLHHDILSKDGAGKVLMKSAPSGTGIIAGGAIRAACEVLGIQDIVAKSLGSSNPYNIINACLEGLKRQSSPKTVSECRGKKISLIVSKFVNKKQLEMSNIMRNTINKIDSLYHLKNLNFLYLILKIDCT